MSNWERTLILAAGLALGACDAGPEGGMQLGDSGELADTQADRDIENLPGPWISMDPTTYTGKLVYLNLSEDCANDQSLLCPYGPCSYDDLVEGSCASITASYSEDELKWQHGCFEPEQSGCPMVWEECADDECQQTNRFEAIFATQKFGEVHGGWFEDETDETAAYIWMFPADGTLPLYMLQALAGLEPTQPNDFDEPRFEMNRYRVRPWHALTLDRAKVARSGSQIFYDSASFGTYEMSLYSGEPYSAGAQVREDGFLCGSAPTWAPPELSDAIAGPPLPWPCSPHFGADPLTTGDYEGTACCVEGTLWRRDGDPVLGGQNFDPESSEPVRCAGSYSGRCVQLWDDEWQPAD